MEKLKIAVIAGTSRPGRLSIRAARFVFSVVQQHAEIDAIWVDVDELQFEKDGNNEELKNPQYSAITKDADGFFIVTPEYNHSYPGSLKRMLDSEYGNYKHKPVAMAGVSDGQWGGIRCLQNLLPVLRKLGLVTLVQDVQFPKVQEIFNESGELQDPAYTKRVERVLDELIWMAKVLKAGRDQTAV